MNRMAPGCFLSSDEHGLQPLLEVAAVLGAGDQRARGRANRRCCRPARRAPCPRRSAARGLRPARSCRRRPRRRTAGCSCGGGTGSRPCARSRACGRSADRSCRPRASWFRLVAYFSSAELAFAVALALAPATALRSRGSRSSPDFESPCEMKLTTSSRETSCSAEQVGGVRVLLAEDRDQHVGDRDFLLAARLHVEHRALQHALEARASAAPRGRRPASGAAWSASMNSLQFLAQARRVGAAARAGSRAPWACR